VAIAIVAQIVANAVIAIVVAKLVRAIVLIAAIVIFVKIAVIVKVIQELKFAEATKIHISICPKLKTAIWIQSQIKSVGFLL
jgi:hypothetical protein